MSNPCPSVWAYFPDLPPTPPPLGTTIPDRSIPPHGDRGPGKGPPRKNKP